MKMNLNLTVTDEQRNTLACLLAGKDVKRLASRDDVAGYVLGLLAGLHPRVESEPDVVSDADTVREVTQRRTLSQEEARKHDELIAAGHPEGYARGWINASRRWFNGRV